VERGASKADDESAKAHRVKTRFEAKSPTTAETEKSHGKQNDI
jgi:hypothetical protein